jgi:hypothetical protein
LTAWWQIMSATPENEATNRQGSSFADDRAGFWEAVVKGTDIRRTASFPLMTVGLLLAVLCGGVAIAAEKPEVPVVNAMVGSCSASFTVLDPEKKPVYGAKITVVVRFGLAGIRKTELQVGTNSEGKARVIGLPERAKKPLEFRISSGFFGKTIEVDATEKCESTIEVVLEKQ